MKGMILLNKAVWLEVALNGPWTRSRQPNIPIYPDEIIKQAVECAKAGASIIHFHAYDIETGKETTDIGTITHIMEGIRSQVDVVVYPLIRLLSPAEAVSDRSGTMRFEHTRILAKSGLLEWMVLDPGSCNLSLLTNILNISNEMVYINSNSSNMVGLELAVQYKLHPSFAIYEPGFVRNGAALANSMKDLPTPIYRFMFTNQFSFGFPPGKLALESYVELLERVSPGAPWMVAGLGVDIFSLIPKTIELGGHVRVGLEDAMLGLDVSNRELVEDAVRLIEQEGASLSNAKEIREKLSIFHKD